MVFTHEALREWEARFAPLLADRLRAQRRSRAGQSWYVDETYLKVHGAWCSLYRAIDREGNLVDARLSETRDLAAARRFFRQAVETIGQVPEWVTTDGHDADPRAIHETLGDAVMHRTSRYLNNRLEQDHRGIKQRSYPLRGFGGFAVAARCCPACEEQRQYFRARRTTGEQVSLVDQRQQFQERWARPATTSGTHAWSFNPGDGRQVIG